MMKDDDSATEMKIIRFMYHPFRLNCHYVNNVPLKKERANREAT